jgi:glycerophosphoryl diester phosphodiesterase
MNYWTQSRNNIYVAGHMGWCEKYPENTMEGFRAAVALGVDQIETDLRISADGEIVLIHDEKVDRTTNGTGYVREMTVAQLKELDAGIKKGEEHKGAQIPTFRELMEFVKDVPGLTLDLELKEYPEQGRDELAFETADKILAMVDEYNFLDRVVINSFSAKLHEYILQKYGRKYRHHVFFPLAHMRDGVTIDPYSYAYCCCMSRVSNEPINLSAKEHCDALTARGVEPWAPASVRDEYSVDLAIEAGCTLITCNNPDEVLRILRAKGYHK